MFAWQSVMSCCAVTSLVVTESIAFLIPSKFVVTYRHVATEFLEVASDFPCFSRQRSISSVLQPRHGILINFFLFFWQISIFLLHHHTFKWLRSSMTLINRTRTQLLQVWNSKIEIKSQGIFAIAVTIVNAAPVMCCFLAEYYVRI